MKIRKGVLFSFLLVAGLAFVGFSPQSYAATQRKDLIADWEQDVCTGNTVGSVVVKKMRSDVVIKVKITNGAANKTWNVAWCCQSEISCSRCSCGPEYLGTFTTDGSGKGKFKYKGPMHIPLAGGIFFFMNFGTSIDSYYYSGGFAAP